MCMFECDVNYRYIHFLVQEEEGAGEMCFCIYHLETRFREEKQKQVVILYTKGTEMGVLIFYPAWRNN